MNYLDATPRHARVTYRGPEGKIGRFVGRFTLVGGKVRGERKDDVKGGIALNLFFGEIADIVKVERLHPVYETWEVV